MHISELNSKSVCILGYGREGQAMVRALEAMAPEAHITIADQNDEIETSYELQSGKEHLKNLDSFDVIIKSPGIPPQKEFEAIEEKITNTTQIFLDSIDPEAMVIGVTGSKGKSTTASLLYAIMQHASKDTLLIGNIGTAAIDHVNDVQAETIVIMEMSSYQLMHMTASPSIAVVTSFFPEHLDYHGSLDAYKEAKMHITRFQNNDDHVFFYADNEGAKDIADQSSGIKVPFTIEDAPVSIIDTNLKGIHNLGNIAGAAKVAEHIGIDAQTILEAIRSFKGLPHRLQSLGEHHGIEWIDDAISTTPDSTLAAINALSPSIGSIIVGGQDRGFGYKGLGEKIADSNIEHIILFPDTGSKIRDAIESHTSGKNFYEVTSMEQAVEIAKEKTPPGTMCVLSPASPSYNIFHNFVEKGTKFAVAIGI